MKGTVKLNLCLAGAVSAGAYTAGVIDYLLETLERWERAKELQKKDVLTGGNKVPEHEITIEVITGASAGGIEGGFLLMQNNKKFNVFDKNGYDINPLWYKQESLSYDAWVNLTEQKQNKAIIEQLLNTDDLECRRYPSALNSNFFDQLTKKFVEQTKYDNPHGRKYIAKDAELALSITNISGLQNSIPFDQDVNSTISSKGQSSSSYVMRNSKDMAYFKCETDIGVDDITYSQLNYGAIPLCIADTYNSNNFDVLANSLKATSAFPIGFAPRLFARKPCFILENPLLTPQKELSVIKNNNEQIQHWIVDGGAINNEPFELAAYLAQRRNGNISEKEKVTTDLLAAKYVEENRGIRKENQISTILMIDPFPTDGAMESIASKRMNIKQAAFSLIGALRMQPLVKAPQIYAALGKRDYSKFMIAPKRKRLGAQGKIVKEWNGADAIACGMLGGFGGFLDKKFREHDYELGRFNCQRFIQKWFGIEVNTQDDDIIIQNNFLNIQSKESCYSYLKYTNPKDSKIIYPFIPDIKIVAEGDKFTIQSNTPNDYTNDEKIINCTAPKYPLWPTTSINSLLNQLQELNPLLLKRILKLANQMIPNFLYYQVFKLFGGHKKIASTLDDIIKEQYDDRGHIEY